MNKFEHVGEGLGVERGDAFLEERTAAIRKKLEGFGMSVSEDLLREISERYAEAPEPGPRERQNV